MDNDEINPPIVIAGKELKCKKCEHKISDTNITFLFWSIAKRGLDFDEIELHANDKNLPLMNTLIDLWKNYGWEVEDEKVVDTINKKTGKEVKGVHYRLIRKIGAIRR